MISRMYGCVVASPMIIGPPLYFLPNMPDAFCFSLDVPEFIPEPVKFVSIVTKGAAKQDHVASLLSASHYYKATNISDVCHVIDTVIDANSAYYSLEVTVGRNKLTADSRSPRKLAIRLDEHTYNHHSYAGRYIKFARKLPGKGAAEFVTYFSSTVNWAKSEKYNKDLHALVSEVFCSATMVLLTSAQPPNTGAGSTLIDCHQEARISTNPIFFPPDMDKSSHSDTADHKNLAEMSTHDQHELYEYLALVHLNALPDYTSSHVRATCIYEAPEIGTDLPFGSSSLVTVSGVSPALFYVLASDPDVLSVQATTQSASYMTLNVRETVCAWSVFR